MAWAAMPAKPKIKSGELRVPRKVWLSRSGKRLYWAPGKIDKRKAGPAMLADLVALAGQPPEAFRRYVMKWGAFGLCRHNLPHAHNVLSGTPCLPRRDRYGYWEPMEIWHRVALRFGAVLRLAAAEHQDKPSADDDWRLLLNQPRPRSRYERTFLISSYINSQLLYSQIQPTLEWSRAGFGISYSADGLTNALGFLSLQLALAVARSEGLANCSSCGNAYVPTGRKPAAGRRSYCPRCVTDGAPQRDASRDYRQRNRKQTRGG